MKMNFKAISLAAASAALCLAAVSCDKKNDLGGLPASEKEMKNIVEQYVPGVVYATYGDLAKETGELYDLLAAAAEGGVKTLTQAQLDAICAKFLQARQSWEESEAFLFGAASDFGIDPHIDTWPLDVDGLATELSNAEKVAPSPARTASAMPPPSSARSSSASTASNSSSSATARTAAWPPSAPTRTMRRSPARP